MKSQVILIAMFIAVGCLSASAAMISEANVLSGKAVVVSSQYGGFPPAQATDGTDQGFIFADGDMSSRLVIHGFDGGITLIRVWSQVADAGRVPAGVVIKSSITDIDSVTGTFESFLTNPNGSAYSLAFTQVDAEFGYADVPVSAVANTKSLFFDFGGTGVGLRINEVQAFPVPEPGMAAVLLTGAVALFGHRRRRVQ